MFKEQEKKQQGFLSSVVEFIFLLMIVFFIRTFFFGLYQVPTGSMETTMLVGERFFADKFSYNFRKPRHGEIVAFNDPEFIYSENALINLFQRYVWGPSNWTKRVIGVPGDVLLGVVEDGKPIIYRNGERLSEPYINKYPLIRSWKHDLNDIFKNIGLDLQKMSQGRRIDREWADRYMSQRLSQELGAPRSYDPSRSYDQQEFYRLKEDRIYKDEGGNPDITVPGVPLFSTEQRTTPDQSHNNWNRSDIFFVRLAEGEYWCMGDNRLGSHDCRFFGPIQEHQIHGRIVFRIWSVDSDESWWIVDLIKHPIDFFKRVRWNRFLQVIQ